jgi:quinoprotein relay system zinc metallohydrolase 2
MTEVAPGIHVRHGMHEDATAENQDEIANIGFIVGDRSVAVIDPGGSRTDGEALRAHLRTVTDRPISHVIMTHMHPDHVFGCVAFEQDHPHFVAHARMLPMLVSRGEFYRNRLADVVGLEAAGDYAKPDILVQDTGQIDLGGRNLVLQAHRTAHTDNDLTILDQTTETLWTGDLLFVDRVPSLDGSIIGWLAVIQTLRALPAQRAVPGHGPVSVLWPDALAPEEAYLSLIARDVRAIIARGGNIEDAVATVGASERGNWKLFDDYNGRNVTAAFKELEWE